jgi:polygalacturonase
MRILNNNSLHVSFLLILLSVFSCVEAVCNSVISIPYTTNNVNGIDLPEGIWTDHTTSFTESDKNRIVNVRDFGASGDGITDDTKSIISAVAGSDNGLVVFPRGSYRITETIEIILSETGTLGLSGKGGSARIIMDGEGPAFRFIGSHNGSSDPKTVREITWLRERMPTVTGLEIAGKNPKACGLEFLHTIMPVIRTILIRDVHHGILLKSRNRNVIIDACHIYNCTGIGILLDSVNLHQIIVSDSHISYCKLGGIKVSGSEIRNFQITGNDIEYNCNPEGAVSADIWVDCSEGGSVREGTITGNTIQAIPSPDGSNIRFSGPKNNNQKIGLWSITGNHISNQTVNICLEHTRGISITGNTFIRGYDRSMKIYNSHNLIISDNVIDHNKDYYPETLKCNDGISINESRNIILSNNIIDGAEYGDKEAGGAVTISDSYELIFTGCQIINPGFRGIHIDNCTNIRITNCMIKEDENNLRMLWGMELTGNCNGCLIKDNLVGKGSKGDILNTASGATIVENVAITR